MTADRYARLKENIERIEARTAAFPELRQAHHFLYDLRSPPQGKPRFVIMGINPGESSRDWEIAPRPTEETSRFDFHRRDEKEGSALRWSRLAHRYLDGADYVLAEVFFWSSRDLQQFVERYGRLSASPHLAFCRDLNLDLIDCHRPEAVVLPGLGLIRLCSELYQLRYQETIRLGGVRVAERFSDGERPWLFTKHWTGARGLSAEQQACIHDAIRRVTLHGQQRTAPQEPAGKPVMVAAGDFGPVIETKLAGCSPWVQEAFRRLDRRLRPSVQSATLENNGPGLRYRRADGQTVLRVHPKRQNIALGLPNDLRQEVAALVVLRPQRDSAWITYEPSVSAAMIDDLIDLALRR